MNSTEKKQAMELIRKIGKGFDEYRENLEDSDIVEGPLYQLEQLIWKIKPIKARKSVTRWIVTGEYGGDLERPEVYKTEKEAWKAVENIISNDVREDYQDDMEDDGVNTDDDSAVIAWGEENNVCTGSRYMGDDDWHEFDVNPVKIQL